MFFSMTREGVTSGAPSLELSDDEFSWEMKEEEGGRRIVRGRKIDILVIYKRRTHP